jgi:hypothetical protein
MSVVEQLRSLVKVRRKWRYNTANERGTTDFLLWVICQLTLFAALFGPPAQIALAQGGRETRQQNNSSSATETRPSLAEVDRAITLSAGYLKRACGPDGKFVYMVDIGSGRESSAYDIVRHAGAMYGLALLNRSRPDADAVKTVVRGAKFMRENFIGPGPRANQVAVWARPLNHRSPAKGNYAELGGSGLGLVALTATRKVEPHAVRLKDIQALGRFLLFLQKEDGSFVHKYDQELGLVADREVLYYPGEAALGLIGLYEADHSNQWLVAAAKGLAYLARSRVGKATVPADHWALIATSGLMPYLNQVSSIVSRDELMQHVAQVCNSIVHEQFRGGSAAGLDGAFDPKGRTAPAATRLEGLLAALEFLPDGELHQRVEAAIARGIGFLLRAQVRTGRYAGGLSGAVSTTALDSSDVRVDYVQHAMCAWLRYEKAYRY